MKLSTFAIKGEERVGAVIARDKVMIDLAAVEKTAARREKRKVNDFYGSMLEFLQAGNKEDKDTVRGDSPPLRVGSLHREAVEFSSPREGH